MEEKSQYIVMCWSCAGQFDAASEPFCSHRDPTIICPFCLRCCCEAPDDYKKEFARNSPKELLKEKTKLREHKDTRLGELLLSAGKITEAQLQVAIAKQNILKKRRKRLGEALVMMKLISPRELFLFLEEQKAIEKIDLKNFEINIELINNIGRAFCLQNKIIPIEIYEQAEKNFLRFAASSRKKIGELMDSSELKGYSLIPNLADEEYIEMLIDEMTTPLPE